MSLHVAPADGDGLATAVDALLEVEPYLDYDSFAPLAARAGSCVALHRQRWLSTTDDPLVLVCRDPSARPLAALRLARREFESNHLAREMARAEAPLAVADEQQRCAALTSLYGHATSALAERGFTHLAARASTRDAAAAWAVQQSGARHVDTQVSWMAELGGAVPATATTVSEPQLDVRVHERDAIAALPRGSWRTIHEYSAHGFDRGPLVFDFDLPRDRTRTVYGAWTENVMTGRWADAVLTAWDGDEIVAFISMLEIPDLSAAAGTRVCGRGLGATLPGYRGLFTAIQRVMIARSPLGARYMENETQVATVASVNVYAKLGFRYQRSTCTYHRPLASEHA